MDPRIEQKQIPHFPPGIFLFFFAVMVFTACSFDYGDAAQSDKSKPDIVMENLEYVRVRGGDPLVRFQAEHGERWEERQTMELRNFLFEQMENSGKTINAEGRAGLAVVQLNSGDISLKGGVRIKVDSEDVTIRTAELEWKDKPKTLTGRDEDEVDIQRSDGTFFSGRGFFADAYNRTWSFSGEVRGTYVEKEDDEEEGKEAGEIETGIQYQTPMELTEDAEKSLPSREEPLPVADQHVPAEETIPVPDTPLIPAPKPSIPAPDLYLEPKPSIPVPEQYLPPVLPEDK